MKAHKLDVDKKRRGNTEREKFKMFRFGQKERWEKNDLILIKHTEEEFKVARVCVLLFVFVFLKSPQ